jgi:hypothetical protein
MDLFTEADLEVDAKSSELALGIVSGVLLMAKDSTEVGIIFTFRFYKYIGAYHFRCYCSLGVQSTFKGPINSLRV